MISIFITALKVIILLGFLIFIHEGGHFIVAKLCKVKVNEFAIGFGPTIWKKQGKETKYALRLIPLGGFVSMEGEEERSDKEGSFSKTSIPKRIAIVVAGGIVNILFGLLVYFILVASIGNYTSQKVDIVDTRYGAYNAGIIENDEIVKINGKRIRSKSDIEKVLEKNKEEVVVTIKRNNNLIDIKVIPTAIPNKDTGIYLSGNSDEITTKVIAVEQGSPAQRSGLEANDIILKIDGKDVDNDPYKVAGYIKQSENEECVFTIKRKEEIKEISIKPDIIYTYVLGVQFAKAENNFINNIYYGFWDTVDFSLSIIDNVKMLFTGKVNANQLMGPVGISGIVAETKSAGDFIYIVALISLSLGVTNLLPFPPLDGGKVVIYIIEAIRRKPIKESTEAIIQTAGFFILIGLSIYVTYNDILRIL